MNDDSPDHDDDARVLTLLTSDHAFRNEVRGDPLVLRRVIAEIMLGRSWLESGMLSLAGPSATENEAWFWIPITHLESVLNDDDSAGIAACVAGVTPNDLRANVITPLLRSIEIARAAHGDEGVVDFSTLIAVPNVSPPRLALARLLLTLYFCNFSESVDPAAPLETAPSVLRRLVPYSNMMNTSPKYYFELLRFHTLLEDAKIITLLTHTIPSHVLDDLGVQNVLSNIKSPNRIDLPLWAYVVRKHTTVRFSDIAEIEKLTPVIYPHAPRMTANYRAYVMRLSEDVFESKPKSVPVRHVNIFMRVYTAVIDEFVRNYADLRALYAAVKEVEERRGAVSIPAVQERMRVYDDEKCKNVKKTKTPEEEAEAAEDEAFDDEYGGVLPTLFELSIPHPTTHPAADTINDDDDLDEFIDATWTDVASTIPPSVFAGTPSPAPAKVNANANASAPSKKRKGAQANAPASSSNPSSASASASSSKRHSPAYDETCAKCLAKESCEMAGCSHGYNSGDVSFACHNGDFHICKMHRDDMNKPDRRTNEDKVYPLKDGNEVLAYQMVNKIVKINGTIVDATGVNVAGNNFLAGTPSNSLNMHYRTREDTYTLTTAKCSLSQFITFARADLVVVQDSELLFDTAETISGEDRETKKPRLLDFVSSPRKVIVLDGKETAHRVTAIRVFGCWASRTGKLKEPLCSKGGYDFFTLHLGNRTTTEKIILNTILVRLKSGKVFNGVETV